MRRDFMGDANWVEGNSCLRDLQPERILPAEFAGDFAPNLYFGNVKRLLLSLIITVPLFGWAHDPDAFAVSQMLAQMDSALQLSDAQFTEIEAHLWAGQDSLLKIQAAAPDSRTYLSQVRSLRAQVYGAIRGVLTAEQQAGFEALRSQWEAERKAAFREHQAKPHDHGHQHAHPHDHPHDHPHPHGH